MRQLFIVHGPVYGGGVGQFARLREPLAQRGCEIAGVGPAGSHTVERLREEGVETIGLPLHRLRRTVNPRTHWQTAAAVRSEIAALRRLIRDRDIDVVQAHGDTNPHAAIAAHLEGRAVVWQIYDTVTPPPARRLTMPLVTRIADVITTWGRQLGHAYPGTARLGERWITVFPPVDGARFTPDPARRAAARAELAVADDALVLGAVGNRNPTKGYEHLARALAVVRRHEPRAIARVLGAPSPPHVRYEASVLAEVEALGLRDAFDLRDGGRRVPDLMPGFDVLVLSSVPRSEGMPTVILEAMACGLPVVATDVGAVRELVDDGVSGYVVAPEDHEAIADRVLALARDPQAREAMGAAGLRRFRERFALDVLADLHVEAYTRAIEHRRARARR